MPSRKAAPAAGDSPVCQLKIALKYSQPRIWRRVLVPANTRLAMLHEVIQVAMGWTNSHLHHFIAGSQFYGQPCPGMPASSLDELDSRKFKVADLASKARTKFLYEYDFGDGWLHELTLEKILPPDPKRKHAVCVAGANACPPEDCGGMGGYYQLRDVLADPKHPEHEEMLEWVGGAWDSAAFDIEAVNKVLKRLKL